MEHMLKLDNVNGIDMGYAGDKKEVQTYTKAGGTVIEYVLLHDEDATYVIVLQKGNELFAGEVDKAYGNECCYGDRASDNDKAWANGSEDTGECVADVRLWDYLTEKEQKGNDDGSDFWEIPAAWDAEERAEKVMVEEILWAWNGKNNQR